MTDPFKGGGSRPPSSWRGWVLAVALLCLAPVSSRGADSLDWNAKQNLVSADLKARRLDVVLAQIAKASGWTVFVEPDLRQTVSVKFRGLNTSEALAHLLGDLNYAVVPDTNGHSRLLVFRTVARNATQVVNPADRLAASRIVPNQLIVRLKPGANIDALARALGAKVIGRIPGLNTYLLQFDDAAATDTARAQLAANPEVAGLDNNFYVDAPAAPASLQGAVPGPPQLQVKAPAADGRVVIGLIDTHVQTLGNGLDAFLLKTISENGPATLDANTPSHGTSMAETALRSVEAMTQGSSSVQILPVDVFGSDPTSTTFNIAKGVTDAVNGGANIINLSLGGTSDSPMLHSVIADAKAQGVVFWGSAGNDGSTELFYPAAYPEVNSVTAVDQGQIAAYANRGSWVSYAAPGTSVIYYNGQPWTEIGTSPSAAYLSGVMAGYMDANHATAAQALAYVRSQYGVTIGGGK